MESDPIMISTLNHLLICFNAIHGDFYLIEKNVQKMLKTKPFVVINKHLIKW